LLQGMSDLVAMNLVPEPAIVAGNERPSGHGSGA